MRSASTFPSAAGPVDEVLDSDGADPLKPAWTAGPRIPPVLAVGMLSTRGHESYATPGHGGGKTM